jgi:hypothetical protein
VESVGFIVRERIYGIFQDVLSRRGGYWCKAGRLWPVESEKRNFLLAIVSMVVPG